MTRPHDPADAVAAYLADHESRDLLRFITCGSVDDGKSTLIGRLLHDTRGLFADQIATLADDSRRHGTQGGSLDYALLLDGLSSEREQGITIDVAYRFFSTAARKFIVADCPGHEQYTRNMATGASTAEAAVVLIDARKGVLTQTRRHTYIVSLLGIRHVVLAVNKMDLVGFDRDVFDAIVNEYASLAKSLGIEHVSAVPLSALQGDNLVGGSPNTPWYSGPSLLQWLESVPVDASANSGAFRLPVQWVNRPDQNFRGFSGTLVGGAIQVGNAVVALPSGRRSVVDRVIGSQGDAQVARAGEAITITLADELDVSRGDVLCATDSPPEVSDQLAAHLIWFDSQPLLPGRAYRLRIGSIEVGASVTEIKHRLDVNTQEAMAAKSLEMNEVGVCNLYLDHPVPFEAYRDSRELGGFILVDRQTNATVAAGTIDFALRRAANIHRQQVDVDKTARARIKRQQPTCVWFTGLSGSGKSTIANGVEKRLHALGLHTYILDGDNVRHGLTKDLGFTAEDRVENIRRVAEVARLMVDAGLIVLVSFISPFRSERRMARALFEEGEFIEAYVDTPLQVAESRDAKGLYAKARAGAIPNFTGIDSPYEVPESAELVLDTVGESVDALADRVVETLVGLQQDGARRCRAQCGSRSQQQP